MTDTTPAGVYELCDAKRLLGALNFIVNEALQDGDENQEMIFALLDAISAKLDLAVTAIEAPRPE